MVMIGSFRSGPFMRMIGRGPFSSGQVAAGNRLKGEEPAAEYLEGRPVPKYIEEAITNADLNLPGSARIEIYLVTEMRSPTFAISVIAASDKGQTTRARLLGIFEGSQTLKEAFLRLDRYFFRGSPRVILETGRDGDIFAIKMNYWG